MSADRPEKPSAKQGREARLAAALRANLKLRKSQARLRTATDGARTPPEPGKSGPKKG
jgi:hypothetical protein